MIDWTTHIPLARNLRSVLIWHWNETTPAHTYPPDATGIPPLSSEDDETLQSECLLCLSSPREVVLLPCRHLVACKERALNMVEYGAGGNISYGTEPAGSGVNATKEGTGGVVAGVGGGAGGEVNGNESGAGSAPATATTSPAVANARRKRKPKGGFVLFVENVSPFFWLLSLSFH